MPKIATILMILLLCPWTVVASEDVIVRMSVTPEEAWVGQRVVIQLDVLGKERWAQITKIESVNVTGA